MLEKDELFESPYEWQKFTDYLIKENRYVLNERWQKFIKSMLHTSSKREYVLKAGRILARARIGIKAVETEDEKGMYNYFEYPLPPDEMGTPPIKDAIAGRLNPSGISYLYVSSDEKTAIAEVRPWKHADVSVGYFKILNDQRIVDLTKDQHERIIPYVFGESLLPEELEESIWASINGTFSRPVSPQDQPLHYVPTQYLTEVFKLHGFDGIGYRSSLNNSGFNIVLFNPECVKLRYSKTFRVDDIDYKCSETGGTFSYKDQ
jgi:hypothetical protein